MDGRRAERVSALADSAQGCSLIRAGVVSPVRIHRERIAEILDSFASVEVIMAGRTWHELATSRGHGELDVVVLDAVEGSACAPIVRALARTLSRARVVVVGLFEPDIVGCAEAGMAGYVGPEASADQLAQALNAVMRGELECPARVVASLARRIAVLAADRRDGEPRPHLTRREIEILSLLGRGFSNKDIASELCIEAATVKNHVHNVLAKLEVSGRAQAAAWYRDHRPELGDYGVARRVAKAREGVAPEAARPV